MCFGFAGDVQDNTAPEEQESQLLRSLSTAIEEAWLRPKREHRKPYEEKYMARLDKLAALPADRAVALALDERLTVLQKHLVEIAMARKERPETWEIAAAYYDAVWGRPDYQLRAPRPIIPEADHCTPNYRGAWEWLLVANTGFGSNKAIPETAANALGKIGNKRSLDLLELQFRWVLQTGEPTRSADWVFRAFSQYPEGVRPQALRSAYECWSYASRMAGKRVNEERVIPADEPDVIVQDLIRLFSAEFLSAQMEKAEPETEYAKFLGKLREEQRRIGK
jgi:hypothetical protein